MRKYHQLLLFVISIVSLSLLLIYRHEYNRLHYVLEVFNFFGQPCNFSDLQEASNVLNHHDWGPLPVWQENEDFYAYSSFWTQNDSKTIILQTGSEEASRNCYLWYENKQKPVVGKYKYSKLGFDERNALSAYFYYCSLNSYTQIPYAVSFTRKSKKQGLKKIPLFYKEQNKININVTLCVTSSGFTKEAFLEFLSYHALVGVDSFIFYSDTIPYRLVKITTNLSTRLGLKIAFMPWNFPKTSSNDFTRDLIEKDCKLRALNDSKNIVALEMNEYLVPTKHFTLNEVLNDFETTSNRLSLPIQEFCIFKTQRNKPVALQNWEATQNNDKKVRFIYKNSINQKNIVNTQAVDKGFASVHKYVQCKEKPIKTSTDTAMMKYYTDFLRSTLVQLIIHNKI